MNCVNERNVRCPYCGERFSVVIDCSVDDQSYVEDCAVCCQPVILSIHIDDTLEVSVQREND